MAAAWYPEELEQTSAKELQLRASIDTVDRTKDGRYGETWRVRASKPLLRRLTWLLRPVFAANHRWAMARGEESLRLELRRRRATSEAERRRVPLPPPATFGWLTRGRHA
jgi:hypothetical protein